jgi:C_GCAxxG_C_C family probable redox protein
MINDGFGNQEDLSCSEKILYAANKVYDLKLEKEVLKMSAGLAGGLYTGKVCGALSAAGLVLAKLFIKERAHEGPYLGNLISEFMNEFEKETSDTSCSFLKDKYRTPETGCTPVILKAAIILDKIIIRELKKAA